MTYPDDEFDKALGRFVQNIALVETALFDTVSAMSNVDTLTLSNINTTWRVAATIDIIKRLFELESYDQEEEVREALGQLGLVEKFRNGVLHGITTKPDDLMRRYLGKDQSYDFGAEFVASNMTTARNAELSQNYPVSVEILEGATLDVQRVRAHLLIFAKSIRAERDPKKPKTVPEWCTQAIEKPWRYKPPRQDSKRPKGR